MHYCCIFAQDLPSELPWVGRIHRETPGGMARAALAVAKGGMPDELRMARAQEKNGAVGVQHGK